MSKRPQIDSVIHWVRSAGPDGKDRVPMYFKGRVGFDVRGRPVHLGQGEYTATYGGDAFEDEQSNHVLAR